MTWTDERIEQLKPLWLSGMSAAQCADRLGVSRNAIIGKVTRLGLCRPARVSLVWLTNRVRKVPTGGRMRKRPMPLDVAEELLADGVTDLPPDQSEFAVPFMDVKHEQCRWPLGDPRSPSFMVCGAGKMNESPYCARHHRIAYHRPEKRAAKFTPAWRAA